MRKNKYCPLCGSCFGQDVYLYDAGDIWYHYGCGNKVFEKTTKLTRKEKKFVMLMEKYGEKI